MHALMAVAARHSCLVARAAGIVRASSMLTAARAVKQIRLGCTYVACFDENGSVMVPASPHDQRGSGVVTYT